MSSNVTYNGQTFNGVNAVKLPLATGSGYAEFGSGGASNAITGEIEVKSDEGGSSHTFTIPYNGSGFPVAFGFRVKGGLTVDQSVWRTTVCKGAFGCFVAVKYNGEVPDYTENADKNKFFLCNYSKNSTSSATSYQGMNGSTYRFLNTGGGTGSSNTNGVCFTNNKTIKYYVISGSESSTVYGLQTGVTYEYYVIYSE